MSGRDEPCGLTPVQRDLLLVVQELTALGGGVGPTCDEIRREMGFASKGHVHRIIESLVASGRLSRLPRKRQSLTVLRPVAMPEEPEIVGFFEAPELAARANGGAR